MAADKLGVANMALTMIKAKRITAFPTVADPLDEEATLIFDFYADTLKEVLSEFAWSFAQKRKNPLTLAVIQPTDTIGDFTVLYQVPTDMIKPTAKSKSAALVMFESDGIYSDSSNLGLRYTYLNDTPSTYPGAFTFALAQRLAAAIGFNRTESVSEAKELLVQYRTLSLPAAISADFQKDAQAQVKQDEWENARIAANIWWPL